jgi:hypothetical protein
VTAHNTNQWWGIHVGFNDFTGDSSPIPLSTNIQILNSTVNNVQGDLITVADSDGVSISGNTAHDGGFAANGSVSGMYTPNAIWSWNSNNVTVELNEVYNMHSYGVDGGAFDIDWGSSNVTIQYNYAHDNEGYCAAIYNSHTIPDVTNSIIRYNICSSNNVKAGGNNAEIWMTQSAGKVNGIQIYNNTIYRTSPDSTPSVSYGSLSTTGVLPYIFKNNIVTASSNLMTRLPTFFQIDNNLYWSTSASAPTWSYNNINYTDFQSYKTASGKETNSLYANPILVSPTYSGVGRPISEFKLQSGSPALQKGASLAAPGARDFYGATVSPGQIINIGADNSTAFVTPPAIVSGHNTYKSRLIRWGVERTAGIIPPPPPPVGSLCDVSGTNVCAIHKNGQTFITWPDVASGVSGAIYRYRVVTSTNPITSANWNLAQELGIYISNNSAQLFGGDFTLAQGNYFSAAYRTNTDNSITPTYTSHPQTPLTDLGTPLPLYSGLFVHSVQAPNTSYYAVIATTQSNVFSSYLGSVGPISEVVATHKPIKIADSLNRSTSSSFGKITTLSGLPVVLRAHASGASSSCITQYCTTGDYLLYFMGPDASNWQEGRPFTVDVGQDNAGHNPSLGTSLEYAHRDTEMDPLGTRGGMESFHSGLGLSPLSYVGLPNRRYLGTANAIEQSLDDVLTRYQANRNMVYWGGDSLGAIGGAMTAMHMKAKENPTLPRFAAVKFGSPAWRFDQMSAAYWPGTGWATTEPFRATLGVAPSTLGNIANNVLLPNGEKFGGDGGYTDIPFYVTSNPQLDLPFTAWSTTKNDNVPFPQQLSGDAAFRASRHGYAWVWTEGLHVATSPSMGILSCDDDSPVAGLCYPKPLFQLHLPYVAFTNSSIDDDFGTATATSTGMLDGDHQGCVNCGFHWNFLTETASTVHFTVSNNWMNRSPTPDIETTLASTMDATTVSQKVNVVDASAMSTRNGLYFSIDNEAFYVSPISGNTLTIINRGLFGTTKAVHNPGATVHQFLFQPTGPNRGPFSSMTVDATPRRLQTFKPPNGATVHCIVTSFGGSAITINATVANGIFTLPTLPINATGSTDVNCS